MCLYKIPVGAEQTEMSTQMKSEMFLQVQGMEKMDSEGLMQSLENCC